VHNKGANVLTNILTTDTLLQSASLESCRRRKEATVRPAISYYGGKQKMAHNLIPLIPRHTVYVEPFCGGATVFFQKPWPKVSNNNHYREVINDHDKRLINFYQQLRDNGEELVRRIQLTLYSETEHRTAKELEHADPIEAARRYYVNAQQSFSNVIGGGWSRNVFSRNQAATWANKIAELPAYIDRMASVYIACDDALKVIKQWDSPQTFFYCDPPYPEANQGHYGGYTLDNFRELVSTLDNCQGSFLLSNYDQGMEMPADWERFEFEAQASSRGRVGYDRSRKADESGQNRQRTEVVWRRFNRVPVREEIQKLYNSGAFDCFASKQETLW
jgi:DNA adenine methylase